MNSKIILVGVVVLAAAGGWYVYHDTSAPPKASTSMGDYLYICKNGSQFSMTPSENMAEVVLTAGSQGMFTGSVTLHKMGDGNHYESVQTENPLIVFSGAGEEVQLAVGKESTVCNPVPNPDMAPWNWGDAGEGGSVQPDVTIVVGESIVGKWQSAGDAKFVREFADGGTVIDSHDGKVVSTGTFAVFSKEKPLTVPFPIEDSAVYVQLKMSGTQAETLNFKVNKLTPEELELTYMDRGGVLLFRAI